MSEVNDLFPFRDSSNEKLAENYRKACSLKKQTKDELTRRGFRVEHYSCGIITIVKETRTYEKL